MTITMGRFITPTDDAISTKIKYRVKEFSKKKKKTEPQNSRSGS